MKPYEGMYKSMVNTVNNSRREDYDFSYGAPVLILVLLALAGFFLYGPQALLGVTASKQATKKAASSALGIIGIMSYVSVIFTGAGLGWYSDRFGWDSLYLLMAVVSVVGFIFVAVLWNIKDDGYVRD